MGVRLRYTIFFGTLFLISGAGLLVLVNVIGVRQSRTAPAQSAGLPPGERIATLQRQVADLHDDQSRRLLLGSLLALAVMLVVSLILGRAAAGRVLRPLRTITAATRRITADNLHRRLAVAGPADEVKQLADTIDDLLGRLEESFAAQRRFVADASHELRTPLATIRASLDVAEAKPGGVAASTVQLAGRVRDSLDEVDRLLEGLLLLARAQHGALDDRSAVSLTALAAASLHARAEQIKSKGLQVYAEPAAELTVTGNPVLLARMVDNVIANAVTHNVPGGWIRVETQPAAFAVETGGPVLEPEQVALLGRPFQRLGADRTGGGTGLGLSIVAAVAAAHGGSAAFTARPGGGLRLTITIPVPAPVAA
jgi:signal transduction histidine kinase